MKWRCRSVVFVLFCLSIIPSLVQTFDCYFCTNCLNKQRGLRITARPEDWCYKVVWRSGPGNQQIVSRGASADCRQDSYRDPSMSISGTYTGTARYCCRNHLCNSARRSHSNLYLITWFFLAFHFLVLNEK